jgi:hypothetical protein
MAILYLTSNDGSDMRITKEVKTLSESSEIIFIGIASDAESFVTPYCKEVHFIRGKRNHPFTLLKQIVKVKQILFSRKVDSIHVINEQLMIFFYPLLFLKPTVLDLFDSIFLKKNFPKNRLALLKRLVYAPIDHIIVTDKNRLELMPDKARKKTVVLPNYPNRIKDLPPKQRTKELTILYNGWMGCGRGTEIVEGLINTGLPIKILMAGWFSDDYTRKLVDKYPDKIRFRGVLPQQSALNWGAIDSDYILCVYAPVNQNNINASPNKIFDAIQIKTPLIINSEVKASQFVKEHGIGKVIPAYFVSDYTKLYDDLLNGREAYTWDFKLADKYSWEKVSGALKELHGII